MPNKARSVTYSTAPMAIPIIGWAPIFFQTLVLDLGELTNKAWEEMLPRPETNTETLEAAQESLR